MDRKPPWLPARLQQTYDFAFVATFVLTAIGLAAFVVMVNAGDIAGGAIETLSSGIFVVCLGLIWVSGVTMAVVLFVGFVLRLTRRLSREE